MENKLMPEIDTDEMELNPEVKPALAIKNETVEAEGEDTSETPSAPRGRKRREFSEEAVNRVISFIKDTGAKGATASQISKGTQMATSELRSLLMQLRATEVIRIEGVRRGTRYFPA